MAKSKIHKDEVDWLVTVYKTSGDEDLERESLEKLIRLGLDELQIDERFKTLKSDKAQSRAFEKAWEREKEENQFEKYTTIEKIKIFLFGPYQLFRQFDSGLVDLAKWNYKIKFRQRLILLILGTLFWIFLAVGVFQYSEYKRMQEIEKVDISKWENNRIPNQ